MVILYHNVQGLIAERPHVRSNAQPTFAPSADRSTFFVDFVPEALPGALSAESPKCEGYWPFQALAAAYLVYDCGVESDREVK